MEAWHMMAKINIFIVFLLWAGTIAELNAFL